MNEQQVKAAAQLYKCRDTAKAFFKDKYLEKLEPYMSLIKAVMLKHKINAIESVLMISKTDAYTKSGMSQMLFLAATVEIEEPSTSPPQKE